MASAGRGLGLPREIFEKSVKLGSFWHMFMQFILVYQQAVIKF